MKITAIEAIPVTIPFTHGGPPTGFGGTEWTTLPDQACAGRLVSTLEGGYDVQALASAPPPTSGR